MKYIFQSQTTQDNAEKKVFPTPIWPKRLIMNREKNLADYMSALVNQLEKEGRPGTAHVYRSTLRRIQDFMGGRALPFEAITPQWLKTFQNYLLERGLQWNSISTYMRMLRAVYFRAVDAGLAPYYPRLFKVVYTGTRVTVKRAVDEQVLRSLSELHCPEAGQETERARLLFLLLFMLRGIPFVDIAYLRKCDLRDGVIKYRRRKTGTSITVKVEPQAMQLIERLRNRKADAVYLFPILSKTGAEAYRQYQSALRRFNASLKKLAVLAGVACPLSSYAARHSWATIANYNNYSQELICNAMGHSSVKVTETYFKPYTDDRIGQMNQEIISKVFSC